MAVGCAGCHADVWETYRHTGMSRSFSRATTENSPVTKTAFYHRASDTYFEVVERDGRYFERQYQIGFDGKRTESYEKQIDYVMGSGNHARSYLHRTSRKTLIELPLAWYAEKGGYWAMNPGYDQPDQQGFRRQIAYDCMFCHNAYPEIPAGNEGPRSAPVYSTIPTGIDCQRCHGPGEKHASLARRGAPVAEIRSAIVNPARLSPQRQMEVCMQCHLETTSSPLPASIVRYERGPFSYRPGEPLGEFMLYFDHAPGTGHDDKFEIDGSAYRLRKSECFRKSNGALTCTTCHNPHGATRDVRTVCLSCHAAAMTAMKGDGRHTKGADCIGCHMPKRRTDDLVHVVMTDHWIQRRPPARDLLADIPERRQSEATAYRGEVRLYYPSSPPRAEDELYLAIAQVSQKSNLTAGIERLSKALEKYRPAPAEYSLQLADALSAAGRYDEAVAVYEQVSKREPDSVAALERLAVSLTVLKRYAEAESTLKSALRLAADAPAWTQLGLVEQAQGKASDAAAAFEKAIQLDPDMVEAYNSIGSLCLGQGEVKQAEAALRNAIRIQPNYAPARNNLANLLASTGRLDEAVYQYKAALRYRENYNGARYNYALTLARLHRLDEAQAQLETILRADPRDAGAQELMGNLLVEKGEPERAAAYYREAARSSDQAIRERATRMLRQLGSVMK